MLKVEPFWQICANLGFLKNIFLHLFTEQNFKDFYWYLGLENSIQFIKVFSRINITFWSPR